MKLKRATAFGVTSLSLILSLSACTDPYDPAQRFVGGGLLAPVSERRSGRLLAADPGLQSAVLQVPLEALRQPRHHRTAITMDTLATNTRATDTLATDIPATDIPAITAIEATSHNLNRG